MIKDRSMWMAVALATLVGLLSVFAAPAHAGVVFEKHYGEAARKAGKPIEGSYGEGYRPKTLKSGNAGQLIATDPINYPVSPGGQWNAASGTMVFRVQYGSRHMNNPEWFGGQGTLFALMDSKGKYIMTASITWGEAVPPWFVGAQIGALEISSDVMPTSVWGGWIPFNRKIEVGEWVSIAFAWDNGVNRVYLNGTELKEKYGAGWDNGSKMVNGGDFGTYLQGARTLRIGANNEAENEPFHAGIIDGFEIHDRALTFAPSKPVIASVADDTFKIQGISGKLVAGDTITATLKAVPGGKASFDAGNVKGIAMAEVPATSGGPGVPAVDNGTYMGRYTILPGDDFENGQITGNFVSSDNVAAAPVASASKWTIDTKPRVTFAIDRKELPADSASKARIKLIAKDANGNPVKGRHLKLTLATTDEYTGTVGAGDFGQSVGGTVETRWKGATDSWGELEFDYKAGFAAKTVILTAKDLDSGGVTVDYLTAFKEASIDIALTRPVSRAAARRGGQYLLKVEASRTALTADGRSRSVIRATLLDPNGTAVSGDPVVFTLSSTNGTLRTIAGTTDSSGTATAEYTAGKKIGIVVVTATATLRSATGNVSITLLSDAPAKIILKAKPESLPADGFSRADLSVKVTDINDNPNKDTKVEFRIAKGGGKMEYLDRTTDRFGDTQNRYTAGTTPGIATILATVRSKIPTDVELARARNVLFATYSPDDDEIRVEKWLKKKGDTALLGEGIVEYTVGRSREIKVLKAPFDLTIDRIEVEYWDRAEIGQTLATVTPTKR
ncbi:MAG: invasin domain 3-containing protein [bacterium]|jgi:hypothetical protein